ncbi:MAG: hypothetical protein FWH07_00065 [Oscillospiraceae bacterium]|nr:hypothetical protein [Oscillospiraceae bacterium]
MKKLNSKKGFALVECVVAIGVFTIMSLIVAMLLNAAITTHRSNISETRSLRAQRNDFMEGVAGGNMLDRGDATKPSIEFSFDDGAGGTISPTYDFDAANVSANAEGLQLTEYETSMLGDRRQTDNIQPISLSQVPWNAIAVGRVAGVAMGSPNATVLNNSPMTQRWLGDGGVAGIPFVNTKELFSYIIPPQSGTNNGDVGFIPAQSVIWVNSNAGAKSLKEFRDTIGTPVSMPNVADSAHLDWFGQRPLDTVTPGTSVLYANMVQLLINKDIPPARHNPSCPLGETAPPAPNCTCEPCRIVLHVPVRDITGATPIDDPKGVIGVAFPNHLQGKVWFETVPTAVKHWLNPAVVGSRERRYDIILERPVGQVRFDVFNLALITREPISRDWRDGNVTTHTKAVAETGSIKKWLQLEICSACGNAPCERQAGCGW